jgi:integrase
MSLATIRPVDVRTWLSLMMKKDRAPSTVNATYRTLSKILRTAEIDGLIVRSPCIGIELPRETSHEEMRFLEPAEIHRLAEAIDERYRPLIYTAAYTGMRWGELAGLKVERLNLLRGTVDVVQALTEVSGHLHLGPTKTGTRRTVVQPRFLAQMLGEHIGRYPSAEGYVFTSAEGTPFRRRNFYKRHFKRAVATAGLDPELRFHDLRHTCAALLIAQGHHPKTIQEHLGHSSIRLTLDRYGHLYSQPHRELRQGLEAVYDQSLAAWMRPEREIGGVASADETAKMASDLGR